MRVRARNRRMMHSEELRTVHVAAYSRGAIAYMPEGLYSMNTNHYNL
jgi:hypothetical protein